MICQDLVEMERGRINEDNICITEHRLLRKLLLGHVSIIGGGEGRTKEEGKK